MSLTKKGGKGIWTEWVDDTTGESSLSSHEVKPVKQWCSKDSHEYVIVDQGKRIAECTKCGHELTFIVGKHIIDGNKIKIA